MATWLSSFRLPLFTTFSLSHSANLGMYSWLCLRIDTSGPNLILGSSLLSFESSVNNSVCGHAFPSFYVYCGKLFVFLELNVTVHAVSVGLSVRTIQNSLLVLAVSLCSVDSVFEVCCLVGNERQFLKHNCQAFRVVNVELWNVSRVS